MLELLLSVLVGTAQAQDVAPAEKKEVALRCNVRANLRTAPELLARLKGTVEHFRIDCSGALVTFKGRSRTERGLVLTSGHCITKGSIRVLDAFPAPAAGEVLADVPDNRVFTLETGNGETPRTCIGADRLLYATMTDVDLAVYRLRETYEEIEKHTGVAPLVVAAGADLPKGLRVHAPSARHRNDLVCAVEATVERIKEFVWSWGPVFRMTPECAAISGASGSPILREDTGEVVGVVGTVYSGNGSPCAIMNPCEIANGEPRVAKAGQTYGHFVNALYGCLDASGNLDLGTAGCRLPRP